MRIMVQMMAQPPIDAASTIMIVRVVRERLDAPSCVLFAAEDEAAATWLVSVTDSIETD